MLGKLSVAEVDPKNKISLSYQIYFVNARPQARSAYRRYCATNAKPVAKERLSLLLAQALMTLRSRYANVFYLLEVPETHCVNAPIQN